MSVEKQLESKLRDEVKKQGGLCLKIASPYFTGLPDRQILMKGGKSYWVELKSTGKKPDSRQTAVHIQLIELGFKVFVISNEIYLQDFLLRIKADQR